MTGTDQTQIFASSEADNWFTRNKSALEDFSPATDPPLTLLDSYGIKPKFALDVGGANGYRLAALQDRCGCRAVAVELSGAAIADGRHRHPEVEFVLGASDRLPFRRAFDLVVVNFVFHWIDRTRVERTRAEIDRVLLAGGWLLIGDFLPPEPTSRPYHHLPASAVRTYKEDYAKPFLGSGNYEVVALVTGDHSGAVPSTPVTPDDKVGYWLLRRVAEEGSAG